MTGKLVSYAWFFSILILLIGLVGSVLLSQRPHRKAQNPLQFAAGTNVRLTYDLNENTITAECVQVYDVPENMTYEQIQHLLRTIEQQTNESYIAWVPGGRIVKRLPTYTISINGEERTADWRTPFISYDSRSNSTLVGGQDVIHDSNGLIVGWAD